MKTTLRIAVWSGPRNISTAMMRAWENRPDTAVMDEPFYGAFLATSGRPDPMREAILAAEETDWRAAADLCATVDRAPIVYQKHMCQHMLPDAPLDWCTAARHAFLIRPPAEVVVSFARGFPELSAADLGFHRQAELFETISDLTGVRPPVVTARSVQNAPKATLRALCAALDVPFDPAMLAWPPGPRASDGVWADHWYAAVRQSTGFQPWRPSTPPDPALANIIAECTPSYEAMLRHVLID